MLNSSGGSHRVLCQRSMERISLSMIATSDSSSEKVTQFEIIDGLALPPEEDD